MHYVFQSTVRTLICTALTLAAATAPLRAEPLVPGGPAQAGAPATPAAPTSRPAPTAAEVQAMIRMLSDESLQTRTRGAEMLVEAKEHAKPAVPALFDLIRREENARCRDRAGVAIIAAGLTEPAEIPQLIDLLGDRHGIVRMNAAIKLILWGKHDRALARPAMPALIKNLAHADEGVRLAAALAVGAMIPDIAEAVPELKRLANTDPEPAVRVNAIGTLVQLYDATDPLCGYFKGEKMTFEAHRGADDYTIKIQMGDQRFPGEAKPTAAGIMAGKFKVGENGFDFTAKRVGDTVEFTTGNATHVLRPAPRPAPAPATRRAAAGRAM